MIRNDARANRPSTGDAKVVLFNESPTAPAGGRKLRRRTVQVTGAADSSSKRADISDITRRFDIEYYRLEYPDIDFARIAPVEHFLRFGWYEGRNPNPFFDTVSYLQAYRDVERANINPYTHYMAFGATEGRQVWSSVTPSVRSRLLFGRAVVDWVTRIEPHIDEEFYRCQFASQIPSGVSLAAHYAFRGWREGMRPNPSFDSNSVDRMEVLQRYLVNPLLIQLEADAPKREQLVLARVDAMVTELPADGLVESAAVEGAVRDEADPHSQMGLVASEFDASYYCAQYPDVVEAGIDPLEHFFYTGWREGRDPNPRFATSYYLQTYPDVSAGGSNPFWHFLALGRPEGRLGRPSEISAAAAVVELSHAEGHAEQLALVGSEFDPLYYLAAYPDVGAAGVEPLQHFFFTGWREGRNPNPAFDSSYYLAANEDVRDAGLNPFWHYLVSGRVEGRLPKRPGGHRRASIDAAMVPSQRPAVDPYPEEPEIAVTDLLAHIDKIAKKRKSGLVVSLSHDCYTKVIGGTQIFISDEQKRFNDRDCAYLHISPQLARLSLAPKSDRFLVRIVVDGEYVGLVRLKLVSDYLRAKHKRRRGASTLFVVHCALGFHVPDIVQLWGDFAPDRSAYWLHDYSSLCPGFNLLRNDAEFCGAPPSESLACRVCVYGQERGAHLSTLTSLFEACQFDILSPSPYALDLWLRSSNLPRRSATVHPHWQLLPTSRGRKLQLESKPSIEPLAVAFVGYPSANKGWPVFSEIVSRLDDNERVRFFHFAARHVATLPKVEFVPTEVTPQDRNAAMAALQSKNIKIVLLLSPWPETFSFVLHEAIAAGATIFCLPDSGNVVDVVEREQVGKVFADIDELVEFIGSGAASEFVAESEMLRPAYRIVSSGTTASVSTIGERS